MLNDRKLVLTHGHTLRPNTITPSTCTLPETNRTHKKKEKEKGKFLFISDVWFSSRLVFHHV